jgi:TPR repeat protein
MTGRARAALAALALALSGGIAGAQAVGEVDLLLAGPAALRQPAIDLDRTATRRIGVVVGNSEYQHAPDLENAAADARAMTRFLRGHGFQVLEYIDLDRRGFENLLRRILYEVGPDSEVVFYFAGHGIQIGRRNYLLPVDAKLASPYDAAFETVTLDSLVQILGARSRLQLVILDSCRNNPFAQARAMTELDPTLFETRDGFGAMSAPVNSLVAYATSPGQLALDGEAGSSPFTGSLIRLASADPLAGMRDLLDRVRRDVYTATEGRQVPWESSTLVEPFVFGKDRRPRGAESGFGAARGLATIVAAVGPVSGPVAAAAAGGPVAITAPLDRRISIGEAIVAALGLSPGDRVTVSAELASGRLVLDRGMTRDYAGEPIAAGDLGALVYEYIPEQRPAEGDIADYTVVERLTVSAGGVAHQVELRMPLDPCDFQAGGWLDPEGLGVARYRNEVEPEATEAACRAAIARSPRTGRFHHQLARALKARLDYQGARAAYERARELGHTRAWNEIGAMIANAAAIEGGHADVPAPQEALEFWAEGAERGDPYAIYSLGRQLLRYGKTEVSRAYGFELLGQAVELGHTFAMNELGYYFLQEGSGHADPRRGLRYLTEAAARKDIYGYNNLGLVYDKGLGGVEPDPAAALDWYMKAWEGGHPYAPVNIGRMYWSGRLGAADPAKAIEWYDRGLKHGIAWGGTNAAWIIANKRPEGFTSADAAVRAAKAAVLRDAQAASEALAVLGGLDRQALDMATQMLMREIGVSQAVDGVVGPLTLEALAPLAAAQGFPPPPDDALGRLLLAARIQWRKNGALIEGY